MFNNRMVSHITLAMAVALVILAPSPGLAWWIFGDKDNDAGIEMARPAETKEAPVTTEPGSTPSASEAPGAQSATRPEGDREAKKAGDETSPSPPSPSADLRRPPLPDGQARAAEDGETPDASDVVTSATAEGENGEVKPDPDEPIALALKNANIDQVLKFIGEQTGKPVLKKGSVSTQITVTAPEEVPRDQALDLVYDALLLEGFVVLELEDSIRIVPAAEVKQQDVITVTGEIPENLLKRQSRLIRRVIPLEAADAQGVATQLQPALGPYASITADPRTNQIILTDTIRNILRYERLIGELDREGHGESEVVIVTLQYADTGEVCDILEAFVGGAAGSARAARNAQRNQQQQNRRGRPPQPPQPPNQPQPNQQQPPTGGEVVIYPIVRSNSILVSAPPDERRKILDLIKELDVPRPRVAKPHLLEIEYAETERLAEAIRTLFPEEIDQAEKETVEVIETGRSDALLIVASDENFRRIEDVAVSLDTEQAQKRETRTFTLKYLDAENTATELENLYGQMRGRQDYYYYYSPWSRRNQEEEVKFVAIGRTNSIMAIAPPSEFELIEKLIGQIDIPIDKDEIVPRTYPIRNADATEVEKVLNMVFGNAEEDSGRNPYYYRWRSEEEDTTDVGRLAGQIRFIAYTYTNSIIAVTNNKENYEIVDEIIRELDKVVPELANTEIIPLEHADATDLARQLNSLFGRPTAGGRAAPGRPSQPGQEQQQQQPNQVVLNDYGGWWTQQRGEDERPISSLIEQVRFVPDVRTNSLLATAASHNFPIIRELVGKLDRAEPQVVVELRILEVRREGKKQVGLRWTPDPNLFTQEDLDNAILTMHDLDLIDYIDRGLTGSAFNSDQLVQEFQADPTGTAEFVDRGVLSTGVNLNLLLQMLIRNLDARLLMQPTLHISNNTEGKIVVGDDVPRLTSSQRTSDGGIVSSYDYREVGVILTLNPHINKNGTVVLRVNLETSKLTGEQRFGADILQQRKYDTTLAVETGQTVVLGGIRTENEQDIVRMIPILGQIPWIGKLFRNYDTTNQTNELFVFITPEVVFDETDALAITEEIENSFQLDTSPLRD